MNYRICVFAADAHKLFIKDNWYSGITLQEWIFKPKESGAAAVNNEISNGNTITAKTVPNSNTIANGSVNTAASVTVNDAGGSSMDCENASDHTLS